MSDMNAGDCDDDFLLNSDNSDIVPNDEILRTYDTFSLENIFQLLPFEELLEINFQFSVVSILHG
jgi:hypothetical protein